MFSSVPLKMSKLRIEDVGNRYVTVGWTPALTSFKGTLKSYTIEYTNVNSGKTIAIPNIPVS